MFLYRRQGPKKRAKPGPPRKNRGSQKGLPNSARDLLPLIQPATKALAQMLAGRTGASGQLGHARAILAQTERLVADRAHNRLNPAEREEFFEQVARLKLTLSDAESEAEVQATEDEAPAAQPTPVDRERLKEMAMALTSSAGPTSYEDRHKGNGDRSENSPAATPSESAEAKDTETDEVNDIAADVPAVAEDSRPEDPNQLRLPRAGAERVAIQPGAIRSRANGRRRAAKPENSSPSAGSPSASKASGDESVARAAEASDVESPSPTATAPTPSLDSSKKLPKGWIIDEEGFVVPGPAV